MSDNDNRDLFEHDTGANDDLLSELDSLKDLLRERDQDELVVDGGAACDPDIPMLDDVVDPDAMELETAPGADDMDVPVLEEVAFPSDEADIPMLEEVAYPSETPTEEHIVAESVEEPHGNESDLPNEKELSKLIDMLVGHRLRRLRPKLKEEVLEELQRLYPELFH